MKTLALFILTLAALPAFAIEDRGDYLCRDNVSSKIVGSQSVSGTRLNSVCTELMDASNLEEWTAFRDKTTWSGGTYERTKAQKDAQYQKLRCDMPLLKLLKRVLSLSETADELCNLKQAEE